FGAGLDFTAELVREQLHAVADAEDGFTRVQHVAWHQRRAGRVHAGGAAGQDEAPGPQRPHALLGRIVRDQLAIHMVLAHAPRNELAVLRAEVDDRDRVALRARAHLGRTNRRPRLGSQGLSRLRNLEVRVYLDVVGGRDAVRFVFGT